MSPAPLGSSATPYLGESQAPTRADVEAMQGLVLLEFGTAWCGHCQASESRVPDCIRLVGQARGLG